MSRKQRINQIIINAINASLIDVENESNKHHVPEGSETHFKVTIVSDNFKNLAKIARHRMINNLLAEELRSGLHALSLHLYTDEEWQARDGTTAMTPACRDGYRHG